MLTRSGKLLTALCATLFAGAAHAEAESGVNYSLKVTTLYVSGYAGDRIAGPAGCPETGFARFTNLGSSTLTGTFTVRGTAQSGGYRETTWSGSVAPGAVLGSLSISCESSNDGGYNKVSGAADNGIEIRFDGTASDGHGSSELHLSVFDSDVHSGAPRTNPFGVTTDAYVLQGGEPFGRDTGDPYELSQAPGNFTWTGVLAPPTVAMTGPADRATTCGAVGDLLTYDITVVNPPLTLVAGQFAIRYDTSVLQFVSIAGGDSPITSIPLQNSNPADGKLFWVSSVQAGGTGTQATTTVARVTFRAIADDCDGNAQVWFDPAFAPILTADGNGGSANLPLSNPLPVTIDTVGPQITNVPANLTVAADAGAGCTATRDISTPSVWDSCGSATLEWSRSDGAAALTDPWPCGTTTVTWTARDACGRTSTATTTVTVNSVNMVDVTVAYAGTGYVRLMTRCVSFQVGSTSVSLALNFVNGVATATLQVPVGTYSCATAKDGLHTLMSQAPVSISGHNWSFSMTGASALVCGDLNNDNLVDVVDWGVMVVRIGTAAPANTDCSTAPFHADFDGDGAVTNADGNRLLASYLVRGAGPCTSFDDDVGQAIDSILVKDLSAITGIDASAADLNHDGVVDGKDIAIWVKSQSVIIKKKQASKAVVDGN